MECFSRLSILFIAILGLNTFTDARKTLLVVYQQQNMYDVTRYRAVGDGETDDVKAFESAWKVACEVETVIATINVPGGKNFVVSPIVFNGPCKSKLNFAIFGNIIAPLKDSWAGKPTNTWLTFLRIDGLIVDGHGQGTIDGRGESWWNKDSRDSNRPTALRISDCNNLQVKNLNHKNSQKNHVSINGCNNVEVANVSMQAPGESPNTDGIDLSSSTGVYIHDSFMATGDDCVALNGGTSNVNISKIQCGPGHGISIGSLGKDGAHEEVSQITVTGCNFTRTQNGVRIKTWQGGSGFAKNIIFSNIEFVEAGNPVIIDQYYCPNSQCAEQVSNVSFTGLRGTSVAKDGAINLSCSKTVPCDDIVLEDVDIKPANSNVPNNATCIDVKGKSNTQNPVVDCIGE